ncbi:MAG TPA: primase-helicase family protein, partial [Cellvibrionaceae bacterium]
ILFDVVMRSIYGEYARTVGQAQLEGNYNDWMSRALYAVYEEVFSRGQKYAHTGTTKQTITGLKIRIEKKFMSGWEETNHMNCVFLSNEIIPLPVEPWDRRFMVFWPEQTMYESFQCGVDSDLKNGGGEALFAFLLDYPMQFQNEPAPFNTHTKPPMTEAKRKLIEACKPIWEVFCDQWEAGRLELNDELLPFMPIRTGDLFFAFDRWCNQGKESGMGSHKFSTFVSSRDKTIRHLRDLDYMTPGRLKKATFFIPRETDAPTDKTKKEWLGGCVAEFQRLFGVKNG